MFNQFKNAKYLITYVFLENNFCQKLYAKKFMLNYSDMHCKCFFLWLFDNFSEWFSQNAKIFIYFFLNLQR